MNKETLEALRIYIDAAIEEALDSREEGSDGHYCTPNQEPKKQAWENLKRLFTRTED